MDVVGLDGVDDDACLRIVYLSNADSSRGMGDGEMGDGAGDCLRIVYRSSADGLDGDRPTDRSARCSAASAFM